MGLTGGEAAIIREESGRLHWPQLFSKNRGGPSQVRFGCVGHTEPNLSAYSVLEGRQDYESTVQALSFRNLENSQFQKEAGLAGVPIILDGRKFGYISAQVRPAIREIFPPCHIPLRQSTLTAQFHKSRLLLEKYHNASLLKRLFLAAWL